MRRCRAVLLAGLGVTSPIGASCLQYVALMGGVGAVAGGPAAGPGNAPNPFSPKLLTFALDGDRPLPGTPQP
jgi:hypothetical protein